MGKLVSQLEVLLMQRNSARKLGLFCLLSLVFWCFSLEIASATPSERSPFSQLLVSEGRILATQWEMVLRETPRWQESWDMETLKKASSYDLLAAFSARSGSGSRQAYLVNSQGKILWSSHAKPVLESPELGGLRAKVLKWVESGSGSASGVLSGTLKDQGTELRLQKVPGTQAQSLYAVILDQRPHNFAGAPEQIEVLSRSLLGVSLVLAGLLAGIIAAQRSSEKERLGTTRARHSKTVPMEEWVPEVIPLSLGGSEAVTTKTGVGATLAGPPMFSHESRRLRDQLATWEEEDQVVEAFESRVFSGKSPVEVARDFVEVARKLSHGPVLFFSHQPQLGALVLDASSGLPQQNTPGSIRFPVSVTLLDQVQSRVVGRESEALHGAFELTPDSGLSDSMLHHFGVGHFEAWAIPYYSALGRHAQRASLIGVVVLLQSGMDTLAQKKRFSRMIRTAGLVVENSILSV